MQHTMPPQTVQNKLARPMPEVEARLFLVGCPRSGTTLLQSLLSAHPAVFSVPESHLYSKLLSRNRILRRLGVARGDAPEHFAALLTSLGLPATCQRKLSVRAYLSQLAGKLNEATLAGDKSVWLEKTPRHLYYLSDITRTLPDAKVIHLLRRGHDVVASLYEVTQAHPAVWGGARSIDSCINRWIKDVELSFRYRDQPNHLLVRYETLTENSEACLSQTFAFIGLPYSARVQTDYRRAAARVTAPEEVWKSSAQGELKPASHDKFTRLFTPEEQAYILERTQPYERSG